MADDMSCPRCGVTKMRKPDLRLLINICGHALCETCIDLVFARGSAACPTCGTALRRQNFKLQYFEDASVQREIDIRRQVLRDFNKREVDFPNVSAYNDYLEMVETIIYNLSNNIDVNQTKERIKQYQAENKEAIKKNLSKASVDQESLDRQLLKEEEEKAIKRKAFIDRELEASKGKRRVQSDLINSLLTSDMPADYIVAQHQAAKERLSVVQQQKVAATTFSTGIRIGVGGGMADMPTAPPPLPQDSPYKYEERPVNDSIPQVTDLPSECVDEWLSEVDSWLDEVKVVGGFLPEYVVHKALSAYYDSLIHVRKLQPGGGAGGAAPARLPSTNMFDSEYSSNAAALQAEENNVFTQTSTHFIIDNYLANL